MIRNIIIILLFCLGFAACSKPKVIPDDKLEAIVHDLYIANAFGEVELKGMGLDTLDIYNPIFKKYGYKPKDLLFTLDNLSKRKSVRFTDIIDNVTAQIEKASKRFDSLVALRDTVEQRLITRYRTVVYKNDTTFLKATKEADIKKMMLTLPVEKGSYEISFTYKLDSTDLNSYVQYHHYTIDSLNKEINNIYRGYSKGKRTKETIKSTFTEDKLKELKINFARITNKEWKKTNIQIDSILVVFFPTKEAAEDSLINEMFTKNPLFYLNQAYDARSDKKNFITLPADTTGVVAQGDSIVQHARNPLRYIHPVDPRQ